MAAFIPGASPPLVNTAIFFIVPPGASGVQATSSAAHRIFIGAFQIIIRTQT
jgi:hypothetical protein